jgi:hypothetical protein
LRKLIGFVCLVVSLNVYAEESAWKKKLRPLFTTLLGESTTNRLIGMPSPGQPQSSITMPEIPRLVKSNTDASVFNVDSELRKQGEEFASSSEDFKRAYDIGFLKEVFMATRRAPAREEDLARWLNVLEGGGSREGVYRGLVLDEVYATLERYEEPLSEKLVSWTLEFSKKFLALAYKEEALKQANLFFLKRTIGEKLLEVMDAFEARPDDLRRWYAIYSADLARDFPQVIKGDLRSIDIPENHYKWAQKAPWQHIKSEAIIKLHLVMNYLQDTQ